MNINYLTIHCSATRPKTDYTLERLRADHKARGFSDVGYHYYIRRDGTVHTGRPENVVGAHVKGRNSGNLGVCLEGGLNNGTGKAENNFTPEQFAALRVLIAKLKAKYPVLCQSGRIKGHRDWSPDKNGDGKITPNEYLKECPCFDVDQFLKE